MEEVWKDINLASLNDQNTRPITTRSTFGGVILQDFLARPFTIDPPQNLLQSPPNSSSYSSASASAASSESAPLYCPASTTTPPHLVTALSLNSHPDFHFDPIRHKGTSTNSSSQLLVQQQPHHHNASKVVTCFSNNPSSQFESLVPCFGGNKRFAEPPSDSSNSLGDRRNKRMIKNRESAARSRARKQEKIASLIFLSLQNYSFFFAIIIIIRHCSGWECEDLRFRI